MTIEEQLKNIIKMRYKRVRAFTNQIGIPYTTLDSVFKRGISNSGIGTMIKIFESLNTYPNKIKEQIKNTRHMYSHYTKKNKTIKGDNFIYLYYILELSFRVLVLEDVSVKYGNEIEENLFSIHDWIMENRKKNIELEEYKSATYKMTKKLKKQKI